MCDKNSAPKSDVSIMNDMIREANESDYIGDHLVMSTAMFNGELIHIEKALNAQENGYRCVNCGKTVVPTKACNRKRKDSNGDEKTYYCSAHFSHLPNQSCIREDYVEDDVAIGGTGQKKRGKQQSYIHWHLINKMHEDFKENNALEIHLPKYQLSPFMPEIYLMEEKTVIINDMKVETREHILDERYMIPDIQVKTTCGMEFYIEIAKSNQISQEKYEKAILPRNMNILQLVVHDRIRETDLANHLEYILTGKVSDIENVLIDGGEVDDKPRRGWIHVENQEHIAEENAEEILSRMLCVDNYYGGVTFNAGKEGVFIKIEKGEDKDEQQREEDKVSDRIEQLIKIRELQGWHVEDIEEEYKKFVLDSRMEHYLKVEKFFANKAVHLDIREKDFSWCVPAHMFTCDYTITTIDKRDVDIRVTRIPEGLSFKSIYSGRMVEKERETRRRDKEKAERTAKIMEERQKSLEQREKRKQEKRIKEYKKRIKVNSRNINDGVVLGIKRIERGQSKKIKENVSNQRIINLNNSLITEQLICDALDDENDAFMYAGKKLDSSEYIEILSKIKKGYMYARREYQQKLIQKNNIHELEILKGQGINLGDLYQWTGAECEDEQLLLERVK